MGDGGTQAARRAETRAQLLAAAEHVFIERGFHAASIDEVAARAGRSKGAVYAHFDNKDELLLAVLERRVDSRTLAIEEGIGLDQPLADQAATAGAAFFDVMLEQADWSLLLMEYAAHAARRPALRDRFAARNRRMREAMVALIDEHLAALGLTSPIPTADLAAMLFALGSGFVLEKLIDPAGIADTVFGDALVLLLGGLASQSAAAPPAGSTRSARAR